MRAALADARRGLRSRRRRAVLTALGIALAAAMLSAGLVVADGLGLGFDRAARAADLPDVIVRFDDQPASKVAQRIRTLPDLAAFATRLELTGVGIGAGDRRRGDAVAEVVGPGRRGYAVVGGRDLRPRGSEVLLEKAFAQAWGVHLGSRFYVRGLGPLRVVGFVEAPDNVGFPLAKPRIYVSLAALQARFGRLANPRVDYAEIWLRDPRYLNEVLVQARASQLRPARHPLRHPLRGSCPARPGRRDRHRPAGGAVGDRAGHRRGDARRLRPRRGAAAPGARSACSAPSGPAPATSRWPRVWRRRSWPPPPPRSGAPPARSRRMGRRGGY